MEISLFPLMKSANSNHTLTPPVPHHSSPPAPPPKHTCYALPYPSSSFPLATPPPRPLPASQSTYLVVLHRAGHLLPRRTTSSLAPPSSSACSSLRLPRSHAHSQPTFGYVYTATVLGTHDKAIGAPALQVVGRRLEWALPRIAPLRIAPLALCRFPHSIRLFADTRTRTHHTRITRSRGLRTRTPATLALLAPRPPAPRAGPGTPSAPWPSPTPVRQHRTPQGKASVCADVDAGSARSQGRRSQGRRNRSIPGTPAALNPRDTGSVRSQGRRSIPGTLEPLDTRDASSAQSQGRR